MIIVQNRHSTEYWVLLVAGTWVGDRVDYILCAHFTVLYYRNQIVQLADCAAYGQLDPTSHQWVHCDRQYRSSPVYYRGGIELELNAAYASNQQKNEAINDYIWIITTLKRQLYGIKI